jgi:thioredoxin-like negative regulator of GroEL
MRFLKYILLLLAGGYCFGQEIGKSNGILVVEFYADWNKHNSCKYLNELKECKTLIIDIDKQKDLQEKYNIEVLPTLIVFNNSQEVCRFTGNLLFQLNVKKKEVQAKIDSIIISKFE